MWLLDDGFEMMMCYPAEGESAFVELWYDGDVWADLQLEGLNLGAIGKERTADARAVVAVYLPRRFGRQQTWRFDLGEAPAHLERVSRRKRQRSFDVALALAQLERARDWLVENECDREPLAENEGLTAAGSAFSKMSRAAQARFLDPADHGDSEEEEIPAEGEAEPPAR
jgi:hypothetical protein